MSLADQQKFLDSFEKKLARRSSLYRRYTGNRQHHTFTVTQDAIERAIKDTLEVGLAGKKDASKLIKKVITALKPATKTVISNIATNVKRRGADQNSVVSIHVHEDKPTRFKATFHASQQDNGRFRNIYKQVYTSYDKLLNTYSAQVSEISEKIIGESFGDQAKDYFNLEHFKFEGIAESQVKDALIDSVQNVSIDEADVLDWLERSNIQIEIVRNSKTDTMQVFIGSKVANAEEARITRTRKADLRKLLKDVREEFIAQGSLIPNLPGSDSFVDSKRKKLLKKVADEFTKTGRAKANLKESTKTQGKVSKVSDTAKRKTKKLSGAAPLTRMSGKRATPKRRVKKGIASSPLRLIGIINQKLPRTVAQNMGSPRLNNRTGRFASSVRVVDVAQTAKGFPSFGYTYQRDPYEVFESGSGSRFSSVERDPRTLIDTSIREIAAELALGRFFTRRV